MTLKSFLPALAAAAATLCWSSPVRAETHVPGDYPTIQAAVDNALPGETINIAAGVYEEQVTILFKDVVLNGYAGAVIRAPVNMAQTLLPASGRRAIVGIFGATVSIRGLEIDGALRGNTNPDFNGILYLGAGGQVRDCWVHRVRNDPFSHGGLSAPVRAINDVAFGTPAVYLEVRDNLVEDNFDGMWFTASDAGPGVLRMEVLVAGNTFQGFGPTDVFAEVGIYLGFGVTGRIRNNTVTDCITTIPGAFSAGILAGDAFFPPDLTVRDVEIRDNHLMNNVVGIAALFSNRGLIAHNEIDNSLLAAIAVSGHRNRLVRNRVANADIGIGLLGEEFPGFGIAKGTLVARNLLESCTSPIQVQTGVTGTILLDNTILP